MSAASCRYATLLCLGLSATTLANTYVVTNTADAGAGSLRAAIKQANNHPNTSASKPDRIHFNIPGPGVQRIAPSTQLPAITDPVIIDGYTQPGSSVNTKRNANDAVLLIELHGGASAADNGLVLNAGSTVRGLIINGFDTYGLHVTSGGGHVIEGNFIGTDAAGLSRVGNRGGVVLEANATVGGVSPASRNVVSGNGQGGVVVLKGSATIQGNFIGCDAKGTSALSNGDAAGVLIYGEGTALIGGAEPGAGNVISGNTNAGITIDASFVGAGAIPAVVVGNRIGTTARGTKRLGNGRGIEIRTPARVGLLDNGTTRLRLPNTIAFNRGRGIVLTSASGVTITRNRIFSNRGLGIDLGENGVTLNDQGDGDNGPNGLQNFPLLSSAAVDRGRITITGAYNSHPNTTYRLEFFGSGTADKSGHGEGRWFLGAARVTTGAAGNATINFERRFTAIGSNWVSATATDPNGNTSEFSQAVQVTGNGSGMQRSKDELNVDAE